MDKLSSDMESNTWPAKRAIETALRLVARGTISAVCLTPAQAEEALASLREPEAQAVAEIVHDERLSQPFIHALIDLTTMPNDTKLYASPPTPSEPEPQAPVGIVNETGGVDWKDEIPWYTGMSLYARPPAPSEPEAQAEHVGWCHFRNGRFSACDSDSEGAFKVYRGPNEHMKADARRYAMLFRDTWHNGEGIAVFAYTRSHDDFARLSMAEVNERLAAAEEWK